MIRRLKQTYPSSYFPLQVHSVDDQIFTMRYFTACMQCHYCHDLCCSFGADIDVMNVDRISAITDRLSGYVSFPGTAWFIEDRYSDDEFPGSRYTRTAVVAGACVFLNRDRRGCSIHRYCLENGIDYHTLKPIVCSLFPITFDSGVLLPSAELKDGSLVCSKEGPSAYHGNRNELLYYFGEDFILELDEIEKSLDG